MGKQRKKNQQTAKRLPSANAIDWELRVLELVRAGILSPIVLTNGGFGHKATVEDKRTAGQIERARRDALHQAKTKKAEEAA